MCFKHFCVVFNVTIIVTKIRNHVLEFITLENNKELRNGYDISKLNKKDLQLRGHNFKHLPCVSRILSSLTLFGDFDLRLEPIYDASKNAFKS